MVGLFKKSNNLSEKKILLQKKKELKKLVKEKQYDKVLRLGSEILEKAQDDLDVLFIVGGIYYMQGKHKTAVSYLDKVLGISSYDPEALILKANSMYKLGNYAESEICCNKIKEIDPKNKAANELLEKLSATKQP